MPAGRILSKRVLKSWRAVVYFALSGCTNVPCKLLANCDQSASVGVGTRVGGIVGVAVWDGLTLCADPPGLQAVSKLAAPRPERARNVRRLRRRDEEVCVRAMFGSYLKSRQERGNHYTIIFHNEKHGAIITSQGQVKIHTPACLANTRRPCETLCQSHYAFQNRIPGRYR